MTTVCTDLHYNYVQDVINADEMGLLKSETDSGKLFAVFSKKYAYQDAQACFPWAAKSVLFDEPKKGKAMAKGPYYIKSKCFING